MQNKKIFEEFFSKTQIFILPDKKLGELKLFIVKEPEPYEDIFLNLSLSDRGSQGAGLKNQKFQCNSEGSGHS